MCASSPPCCMQATAQIGVATANMLPQITLTGSYGQAAPTVLNLICRGVECVEL